MFVDHPFLSVAISLCDACSLGRSRSAAQLNVGKRWASKGVTETIRRSSALACKADHFRKRSDSAKPDRANIVRLSINSRRKSRTRWRSGRATDPERFHPPDEAAIEAFGFTRPQTSS